MKRTTTMTWIVFGALILGVAAASAQSQSTSLGDYARSVRKDKAEASKPSHQYDNDNLPTNGQLSVVGPAPAASSPAKADAAHSGGKTPNAKPADANADRQKANEDLQKKLDAQQKKLDDLSHELDLEQREYRMRAAIFYSDAGNRLRDSGTWDKDDAQYKSDMESKQKAIDAAKEQLTQMQEDARKAGIKQKEETTDKDTSNETNKDSNKNDDSSKQ